ncbi:rhomboid family intramembrane serine protease [Bernardetia sp. ABR2-2B]|uniref:rhomboid family intramembrane serine protease n=1 Tax=Bernardetia sp. ABR2-2B TaxID=3127472 RepID=UPI0030D52839
MPRLTPVVKVLLILNIAIFALQYFVFGGNNPNQIDVLTQLFGLRYFGAESFAPYQLITHMFLHGGLWHILGNMYALFIFGPPLETYFDSKRFLALYMIAGLGAAVLHVGASAWEVQNREILIVEFEAHPEPALFSAFIDKEGYLNYNPATVDNFIGEFRQNPKNQSYVIEAKRVMNEMAQTKRNIPTVGASGAIFGILAAFGIVFANVKLVLLFPPIPIKAKYLVFGYALYEIYAIYQANPTDNVAHFAHIGGFIFGIILVKLWGKNDKPMRWN